MITNQAATVSDYQGTATRKSYAPGVAFPLTEKAVEALSELKKSGDRSYNFVSLVSHLTCMDGVPRLLIYISSAFG